MVSCGRLGRATACALIAITAGALSGGALAAPPQEPPGNSANAPGQQRAEEPRPSDQAPGQLKKEDEPGAPPEAASDVGSAAEPAPAAPERSSSVAESPRYSNPQDKPKRNVPAESESAPAASASAPGRSGVHKLTICHRGHAITVDVHAAAAHMKHGDTYLPAGTKGRAACASPPTEPAATATTPPPSRRPESSGGLGTPAAVATVPPVPPRVVAGEGAASGTSSTSVDPLDSGVLTATASTAELPFTGAALLRYVFLGVLLILVGVGLVKRAGESGTSENG